MNLGVRTVFGGRRWILAAAMASVLLPCARLIGQEGAPPAAGASPSATGFVVTGRVLCGDTQRPARFAQVTLLPASESDGEFGGRGGRFSGRTDLDGNFTVPNVPQGDYFLTGQMTGYINESSEVGAALSAGGDVSAALPGVPLVHVGAGGASASLSLQRGGVIAGVVQWDDGSPASGVQVAAQAAPTTGAQATTSGQLSAPPGFNQGFGGGRGGVPAFAGSQTDDRGRFRISGVAPGAYIVRANVQAPAPQRGDERGFARTLNLSVYAPDKPRRTDAVVITVAGAEEHAEVSITLGLAALHNVSGTVSSTSAAVRSGTVSLTDQTDSSLTRVGVISTDGSFVVPYVPSGNYTLRANASSQAPSYNRQGLNVSSQTVVGFQPLQESVTVTDGDLTGLTLNVQTATSTP